MRSNVCEKHENERRYSGKNFAGVSLNPSFHLYSFERANFIINLLSDFMRQNKYSQGSSFYLYPKSHSRFGELGVKEVLELANTIEKKFAERAIIVWDILMTEEVFKKKSEEFYHSFKGQPLLAFDRGVMELARERGETLSLLLDGGNHNTLGIVTYARYFLPEKIILSRELPWSSIKKIRTELPHTFFEILGIGRNLLFYSERRLLSPQKGVESQVLRARVDSLESPHRNFLALENDHGSFYFHQKDLWMLDSLVELMNADRVFAKTEQEKGGNLDIAFDLESLSLPDLSLFLPRLLSFLNLFLNPRKDKALELGETLKTLKNLKEFYPKETFPGILRANKTDLLFRKLKNTRHIERDGGALRAELLESKKGEYLALKVLGKALYRGEQLEIYSPDGKKNRFKVLVLKDALGSECAQIDPDKVALVNHIAGIGQGAKFYEVS